MGLKPLVFISFLFVLSNICIAQDSTANTDNSLIWFRRIKSPGPIVDEILGLNQDILNGKNIVTLGFALNAFAVGVCYERLFTPKIGAELGIGILGFSLTPKYYFSIGDKQRIKLYSAITYSAAYDDDFSKEFAMPFPGFVVIPIGIHFIDYRGIYTDFTIVPSNIIDGKFEYNLPYISLKVGFGF